jgi:hypothetical protein
LLDSLIVFLLCGISSEFEEAIPVFDLGRSGFDRGPIA